MGQLIYSDETSFEFEDHDLAHLRHVLLTKLRRQESVVLNLPHPLYGTVSLWVNPAIRIEFKFRSSTNVPLSSHTVNRWVAEASTLEGLTIS